MSIQFEDVKLAFLAIFKRYKLVAAVTLLGALIGLLVVTVMPVQSVYSTTASVYSATYGSYEEAVDGVSAMVNYSDVVTSTKVCERAAAAIGDTQLTAVDIQRMISSYMNDNSYILYISANSVDPDRAKIVANAVASAFVEEINNITGLNAVQVLDEANDSNLYRYDSTSRKKVLAVIVGISFALICAYIALLELFSGKVKSVEQCMEEDPDEIIGIIPKFEK